MRSFVLGVVLAVALAAPALAQPHGGPGGMGGGFGGPGFGGRGFGPGRPGFGGRGFGPGQFRGGFAGRMQQRFQSANITHDGKLTLSQARDGNMTVVARHFDEIDTAHKGYITMDDVRAYRRRVAEKRRAAQGGAIGGIPDEDSATPPQ